MSGRDGTERRKEDRRKLAERREGSDRRLGEDRRKADLGPPPGMPERRTGWERRIADRRSGGDRRSGLDRRNPTPEALLRAVAIQTARQLVSRLYLQVCRSAQSSPRAREHLETARAELLTLRPDLDRVAKALDDLKSTPAARLPEYDLARELLRPLRSNHKGAKRSKGRTAPLKRRDSLEQLRATLAAPLTPPSFPKVTTEENGPAQSKAAAKRAKSSRASGNSKRKSPRKATKKKAASKKRPKRTK